MKRGDIGYQQIIKEYIKKGLLVEKRKESKSRKWNDSDIKIPMRFS